MDWQRVGGAAEHSEMMRATIDRSQVVARHARHGHLLTPFGEKSVAGLVGLWPGSYEVTTPHPVGAHEYLPPRPTDLVQDPESVKWWVKPRREVLTYILSVKWWVEMPTATTF